ncbi:MAG: hypothetical protein GF387_00685, partial [Candidatus Portnoybacteria bacterium]|nr:hypothetical protein [Candidatus Portnoybacteria bacterium]
RLDFNNSKKKKGYVLKSLAFFLFISLSAYLILFTPLFQERSFFVSGQNLNNGLGSVKGLSFNNERVNLLVLGIPGKGHHGESLTDTIMIINSGNNGENPVGISIPRDLFVKFPDRSFYTKINSLYRWGRNEKQGVELVASVLNDITGLNFDYYAVVDLDAVEEVVDKIGGIDVFVEKDIYDPLYPAPYDSYQLFEIKKGFHHLDGETAVKYMRSRHEAGGDFSRIKRQQQVVNEVVKKMLSMNFWDLPTLLNVWYSVDKNVYTNISLVDIKYVWNLAKQTRFEGIDFHTISAIGDNPLLYSDVVVLGGEDAAVLKPVEGLSEYVNIREYIKEIIDL